MTNQIFGDLCDYHIQNFIERFKSLSRSLFTNKNSTLIHSGEFGMYREKVCEEFLRFFTPLHLGIDTGFVIEPNGEVSNQCDIIIYDPSLTPLMQNKGLQRFFPIETTVAVGEIKSLLTKNSLCDSLQKLSKIKEYRLNLKEPSILKRDSSLGSAKLEDLNLNIPNFGTVNIKKPHGFPFNPKLHGYDQIFTFLICERFDFNTTNLQHEIKEAYQGVDPGCRHNIILSIDDGVLLYFDDNKVSLQFPIRVKPLKDRFVKASENSLVHFQYFCQYFFMATTAITVLYPELSYYMSPLKGGMNYDDI